MAKKASAKKADRATRLPNAPLAEVVFELRWEVQGSKNAPPIFSSDPGLMPLIETFTPRMRKVGFGTTKDMAGPQEALAYSVVRRYFLAPEQAFPLIQIGPGIFASNQSTAYDWKSFKRQTLTGLKELLASYPRYESFPFQPAYLELRYIDAFDESLLGRVDLFHFIAHGTTLKLELPDTLLDKKVFADEPDGRFIFNFPLKKHKASAFTIDIASGRNDKQPIVRLESKVTTKKEGVPKLKTGATFLNEIEEWMDFAHDITSPFFKKFVTAEVMEKFKAS